MTYNQRTYHDNDEDDRPGHVYSAFSNDKLFKVTIQVPNARLPILPSISKSCHGIIIANHDTQFAIKMNILVPDNPKRQLQSQKINEKPYVSQLFVDKEQVVRAYCITKNKANRFYNDSK